MSGCNSRQPHQPSPRAKRGTKAVASKRIARRRTHRSGERATARLANSFKSRTSRAAESPKLSLPGAAPGRLANFFGVVADKQCTCPASKLMWERYPPTPPAFARSGARAKAAAPKFLSFRNEGGLVIRSRCGLRLGKPISLRETRPMHREKPHKLL